MGDVLDLAALLVEVSEVFELLRVHEDIRKEHTLARFIVQVGVRRDVAALGGEGGEVLDTLEN